MSKFNVSTDENDTTFNSSSSDSTFNTSYKNESKQTNSENKIKSNSKLSLNNLKRPTNPSITSFFPKSSENKVEKTNISNYDTSTTKSKESLLHNNKSNDTTSIQSNNEIIDLSLFSKSLGFDENLEKWIQDTKNNPNISAKTSEVNWTHNF